MTKLDRREKRRWEPNSHLVRVTHYCVPVPQLRTQAWQVAPSLNPRWAHTPGKVTSARGTDWECGAASIPHQTGLMGFITQLSWEMKAEERVQQCSCDGDPDPRPILSRRTALLQMLSYCWGLIISFFACEKRDGQASQAASSFHLTSCLCPHSVYS